MSEFTYATLQETNIEEHESWLTFIRYQGNEDALKHLREQLETVEWHCEEEDNMDSAFDLDTDYPVCEKTAKEMTKLDLNAYMSHRKFDGKLQQINLELKDVNSEVTRKRKEKTNDKNIRKVNRTIRYGQIENYINEEDENSDAEYNDETNSEEDDNSNDSSGDSSGDSSSDSDDEPDKSTLIKKLPPSIKRPQSAKKAKKAQRGNKK